ncbi:hypothetical protein BDY17DRAFT_351094 [Neohortaea acidophila]|uniref:Uncharacterized protein n=1 Tax=Neohortaea acidophila TaxID=245834 RepID=A0A6A6Q1G3_9PEZI|nr:uncharacterized protein BDY17DRAFT_351094 [Neohortaea acidophila]KAF2486095.1 hypothetical protein BDY17DRAFT_351094 [Neohortaea acidophila]
MVNKILFWSGFGLAVRFWQLGIEMRPFHHQLWAYGLYGGVGASFGYWMQSVDDKQMRYLRDTRDRLLEKRRRRAEREGAPVGEQEGANVEGIRLDETSRTDVTEGAQDRIAGRA